MGVLTVARASVALVTRQTRAAVVAHMVGADGVNAAAVFAGCALVVLCVKRKIKFHIHKKPKDHFF